jgi:hypothetical protein
MYWLAIYHLWVQTIYVKLNSFGGIIVGAVLSIIGIIVLIAGIIVLILDRRRTRPKVHPPI